MHFFLNEAELWQGCAIHVPHSDENMAETASETDESSCGKINVFVDRKQNRPFLVSSPSGETPRWNQGIFSCLKGKKGGLISRFLRRTAQSSSTTGGASSTSSGSASSSNKTTTTAPSTDGSAGRKVDNSYKYNLQQMPSIVLEHAGINSQWLCHGKDSPLTEFEIQYYLYHLLIALDSLVGSKSTSVALVACERVFCVSTDSTWDPLMT